MSTVSDKARRFLGITASETVTAAAKPMMKRTAKKSPVKAAAKKVDSKSNKPVVRKIDPMKLAARIAKMTDENMHTKSILTLALALKQPLYANVLQGFEKLSNKIGHTPSEFIPVRNMFMKELLGLAEKKWGKEARDKLYSSF